MVLSWTNYTQNLSSILAIHRGDFEATDHKAIMFEFFLKVPYNKVAETKPSFHTQKGIRAASSDPKVLEFLRNGKDAFKWPLKSFIQDKIPMRKFH